MLQLPQALKLYRLSCCTDYRWPICFLDLLTEWHRYGPPTRFRTETYLSWFEINIGLGEPQGIEFWTNLVRPLQDEGAVYASVCTQSRELPNLALLAICESSIFNEMLTTF